MKIIKDIIDGKERAFYNSSNTSFSNIQIMGIEDGESAFKECNNLEMHELPLSVKVIQDMAFENCDSTEFDYFTVSNEVDYIGEAVFRGTTNLETLTLPFVGKQHNIEGTQVDADEMFGWIYGRNWNLEDLTVDASDNANYSIEPALKNVIITEDEHIGAYAFNNADYIETVVIPNTVKTLGEYAFANNQNLTTVTFEETVEQPSLPETKTETKVCKFLFSNPENFVLITGKVESFENCKLIFLPDNPEDTANIAVDTIIKKCTLKVDNQINTVDVKVLKNDTEIEFLICN